MKKKSRGKVKFSLEVELLLRRLIETTNQNGRLGLSQQDLNDWPWQLRRYFDNLKITDVLQQLQKGVGEKVEMEAAEEVEGEKSEDEGLDFSSLRHLDLTKFKLNPKEIPKLLGLLENNNCLEALALTFEEGVDAAGHFDSFFAFIEKLELRGLSLSFADRPEVSRDSANVFNRSSLFPKSLERLEIVGESLNRGNFAHFRDEFLPENTNLVRLVVNLRGFAEGNLVDFAAALSKIETLREISLNGLEDDGERPPIGMVGEGVGEGEIEEEEEEDEAESIIPRFLSLILNMPQLTAISLNDYSFSSLDCHVLVARELANRFMRQNAQEYTGSMLTKFGSTECGHDHAQEEGRATLLVAWTEALATEGMSLTKLIFGFDFEFYYDQVSVDRDKKARFLDAYGRFLSVLNIPEVELNCYQNSIGSHIFPYQESLFLNPRLNTLKISVGSESEILAFLKTLYEHREAENMNISELIFDLVIENSINTQTKRRFSLARIYLNTAIMDYIRKCSKLNSVKFYLQPTFLAYGYDNKKNTGFPWRRTFKPVGHNAAFLKRAGCSKSVTAFCNGEISELVVRQNMQSFSSTYIAVFHQIGVIFRNYGFTMPPEVMGIIYSFFEGAILADLNGRGFYTVNLDRKALIKTFRYNQGNIPAKRDLNRAADFFGGYGKRGKNIRDSFETLYSKYNKALKEQDRFMKSMILLRFIKLSKSKVEGASERPDLAGMINDKLFLGKKRPNKLLLYSFRMFLMGYLFNERRKKVLENREKTKEQFSIEVKKTKGASFGSVSFGTGFDELIKKMDEELLGEMRQLYNDRESLVVDNVIHVSLDYSCFPDADLPIPLEDIRKYIKEKILERQDFRGRLIVINMALEEKYMFDYQIIINPGKSKTYVRIMPAVVAKYGAPEAAEINKTVSALFDKTCVIKVLPKTETYDKVINQLIKQRKESLDKKVSSLLQTHLETYRKGVVKTGYFDPVLMLLNVYHQNINNKKPLPNMYILFYSSDSLKPKKIPVLMFGGKSKNESLFAIYRNNKFVGCVDKLTALMSETDKKTHEALSVVRDELSAQYKKIQLSIRLFKEVDGCVNKALTLKAEGEFGKATGELQQALAKLPSEEDPFWTGIKSTIMQQLKDCEVEEEDEESPTFV